MKKIYLGGESGKGLYALVDNEDYDQISKYSWKITKGYACRNAWDKTNKKYHFLAMHRAILTPPKDKEVDHINNDSLDNRKNNLRICSRKENGKNLSIRKDNKTGYKGVFLEKRTGKYYAQIKSGQQCLHLGTFEKASDAYQAYKRTALILHKEYANV